MTQVRRPGTRSWAVLTGVKAKPPAGVPLRGSLDPGSGRPALARTRPPDPWHTHLVSARPDKITSLRFQGIARLDVLHRHHATVEDRVRVAKQTGLGHLPSASWRVNTAWTLLAAIAADLDAWTRLLGFHDHKLLARAEPATMRELVYQLPARLAHHARRRWLRFDRDHPNTADITTAWHRLAALATT